MRSRSSSSRREGWSGSRKTKGQWNIEVKECQGRISFGEGPCVVDSTQRSGDQWVQYLVGARGLDQSNKGEGWKGSLVAASSVGLEGNTLEGVDVRHSSQEAFNQGVNS